MRKETRQAFDAYLTQIARLNGVPDATEKFAVDPSVQQKLETKIQESSAFLSKINIAGVIEQEGEKLGLGISGPVASTTDTDAKDRETKDLTGLDSQRYRCEKTDSDTHIKYQKLDAWAKFADFQTRIRDVIVQRKALDRIMVGWNGVSRAATSNRTANPMLQDVNKGWLQHYREQAAARVMSEVTSGSGKIVVGGSSGSDYKNLDALVFDMTNELLDPWYAEDPDLVVICGRKMLADKYFPIINQVQPPTEQIATHLIVSQKRIGNLPAVRVPFFPASALMITTLDNLSIYYQLSGQRRTIVDNAKRDRIENYESSNDAYVVEDYGRGCVAENIEVTE